MGSKPGARDVRRRGRLFYGWRVLAAAALQGMFGGGTAHSGFSVFFLPIQRDLGLSYTSMSLVFSLARGEGGASGFVLGWLVDKVGSRPMVLIGGLTAGIGMVLLSQVHAYWLLLLVYVGVVSIGRSAGMGQTLMAAVNQWFIRHKALAMSTLMTSFAMGGAIAVPLLALGIERLGWRATLLSAGLFIGLLTLPVALIIRSKPEDLGLRPDGTLATRPAALAARRGRSAPAEGTWDFTVRQALRTRTFWLLVVAIGLRVVVVDALTVHQIPMLVWKGINEQTAAFYVSLIFILSIPLRFGLGLAGGLFSPRKVVFAGMSVGALGLLGMLTLEGVPAVVGLVVALAVVEGVTSVNWITVSDYFGRSRFASLLGVMSAFLNIGSATAPVLSGWAFDRTQSYNLVLATALPLFLAGGIVFALARPPILPGLATVQGGTPPH